MLSLTTRNTKFFTTVTKHCVLCEILRGFVVKGFLINKEGENYLLHFATFPIVKP